MAPGLALIGAGFRTDRIWGSGFGVHGLWWLAPLTYFLERNDHDKADVVRPVP